MRARYNSAPPPAPALQQAEQPEQLAEALFVVCRHSITCPHDGDKESSAAASCRGGRGSARSCSRSCRRGGREQHRSSGSSRPAVTVEDLLALDPELGEPVTHGHRLVELRDRVVGELLLDVYAADPAGPDRVEQQFRVTGRSRAESRRRSAASRGVRRPAGRRSETRPRRRGPAAGTPGSRSPRRTGRTAPLPRFGITAAAPGDEVCVGLGHVQHVGHG